MIEIIGLVSPYRHSEISEEPSPYDPAFVGELARAYDDAGYDRVLIGQNARSADSLVTASWVVAATKKLKLMIAHRPGFIAPTMAGRALATLDQLSGGRVGVHIITAFSDAETGCDGDFHTKDERYHRSSEYVRVLRKMWSSAEPFDHEGDWYKANQAFSEVHPVNGTIPVFWAGSSELGVRYGAELADVYAMAPGGVEQVGALVQRVKDEATKHGRTPRFSMSMRLVIADTDEAAWERAGAMLQSLEKRQGAHGLLGRELGKAAEETARRAREVNNAASDPHLWTGMTEATKGRLQVMCLVGSPQTLVDALARYHAVGVDSFLVTGFDWLEDTARIGREIAPALREKCSLAAGN